MSDITGGKKIMLTKSEVDAMYGPKQTSYITIAFGISVLNNAFATEIFWQKSQESPQLQIPNGTWIHSIMVSGFVYYNAPAANKQLTETLMGFPVNVSFDNGLASPLIRIIGGNGNGGIVNANFQPMTVPNENHMLIPIGTKIVFEKGQYKIGSTLDFIRVRVPAPWFFQNTTPGVEQGSIGMGAQVVLAYE